MKDKFIPLQKPDNMSEESWNDLLEEYAEKNQLDAFELLEQFRNKLNDTRCQAMHITKKHSIYGNQCPYYIKARNYFFAHEADDTFLLLDQLLDQLEAEGIYTRKKND